MSDYTPHRLRMLPDGSYEHQGKIEIHATMRCDLTCVACSRGSFLRKPHTPDMTIEDVRRVFADIRALPFRWEPIVIIIGGEPTVHPDFLEIVGLAREFVNYHKPLNEVHVYSNGHSARARALCDEARARYAASICTDEWKPAGSRTGVEPDLPFWHMGMFCSPSDAGLPFQGTCYCHSSQICGVGADSWGYALCATGLSVGALLGGEAGDACRTKALVDCFDPVKAEAMTRAMCGHCGYAMSHRGATQEIRDGFATFISAQQLRSGTPMSSTWLKAFEGRR